MRVARVWVPLWVVMLGLGGVARAADSDAEIALQRLLDQPVTLSLQNVALSEAFKQIRAASKIPLDIDPLCYDLLPFGETTRVSIDFKQSKLRSALEEVLIPVGLERVIAGNSILIRPSGPLKHIGRRADLQELYLIQQLWISDDLKIPATGKFNLSDAIRASMEGRKDLLVPLIGDANGSLSPAQEKAIEQIAKQLPMSAYRALEMYCQLTGDIWSVEAGPLAGGPTGGKVVIMSPKQWIARQLERPIKISRTNEPLEVVVADLTHASGIRFVPEPGLYQAVPVVNLQADNATVQQTLESLAGGTRIAFEIREDSILLYLAAGPGAPGGGAKPNPVIGRISVPVGSSGATMDFDLRESDLPPELGEVRQKWLQQARDELLKTAKTQPAMPASVPATATAPASTRP